MYSVNEIISEINLRLNNSYSPYSNFKVGAAVLGENNKWYFGVNVENRSFGLTICAERAASVAAVSDGVRLILKIVIISSGKDLITPCGSCREFLAEFSNEDTEIYLSKGEKIDYKGKFLELLPMRFELDGM